jgi:hypothetical protein
MSASDSSKPVRLPLGGPAREAIPEAAVTLRGPFS